MVYVIKEPTGCYFVEPSRISWDLTENINKATQFDTLKEVNKAKKMLDSAIGGTYWDYDDIIPYPTVVELNTDD